MIQTTVIASENSFYLRIEENLCSPIQRGRSGLIDPDIVPTPGKFVVAINGDNEATFKQYKELRFTKTPERIPHFELVPLNPMFPNIKITQPKRSRIHLVWQETLSAEASYSVE